VIKSQAHKQDSVSKHQYKKQDRYVGQRIPVLTSTHQNTDARDKVDPSTNQVQFPSSVQGTNHNMQDVQGQYTIPPQDRFPSSNRYDVPLQQDSINSHHGPFSTGWNFGQPCPWYQQPYVSN
jgi:hypothetical protein